MEALGYSKLFSASIQRERRKKHSAMVGQLSVYWSIQRAIAPMRSLYKLFILTSMPSVWESTVPIYH